MKSRRSGNFIFIFLFNALALIPLNGLTQGMVRPLQHEILLSGNFGELRATHFHSGIDIRTGGVEGLPVVCVKDGKLVRVSVSPTGYGQALYVEHPDGTTTVYGHLQRFISSVSALIRKIQYTKESFKVDEDFRSYGIFFRQGDTIAYSGNTGSSGGPHLHFEVRNTSTGNIINPLLYYPIRDQKPPVVRRAYLYTARENGCIDFFRECPLKATVAGQYEAGKVDVPEGKIGVGLFVTDYMEDSWNKLGVYKMILMAGQDTLFSMCMDSSAFEAGCLINEVKDFERYKKKETVYRCFGYYQDQLMWVQNRQQGFISVERDSMVQVSVHLWDLNGNRSKVTLQLRGRAGKAGENEAHILRYDKAHVLELAGARLSLDKGALFSSVRNRAKVVTDSASGKPVFILADKDIPLLKKGTLYIAGDYGENALICEIDKEGRRYPVETVPVEGGIEARIGYLNRYVVEQDSVGPMIGYLGKFPDRSIRFRIKDEFSGIGGYRVEVNGEWCLFSYDPRIDMLKVSLSEPVFRQGPNQVRIRVGDKAGNYNTLEIKVVI